MLVFGVISPHPPIIIPDIGGKETEKAIKTVTSLKSAAKMLANTNPDRLLIIAPHQEHGFNVPLYDFSKNLKQDIKINKILVSNPSYEYYYNYGKLYGEKIEKAKERIAVIASGDLSHVLKSEGPYGYDPAGHKLDEIIVRAVKEKNIETLLNIDSEILEHGAECGLRSILFLFGVFEIIDFSTKILSYEAPFGVGYMVALFYKKEG